MRGCLVEGFVITISIFICLEVFNSREKTRSLVPPVNLVLELFTSTVEPASKDDTLH
jgi:hypothetical protein